MASTLLNRHLPRFRGCTGGIFSRQVEEDFLEAHPHGPQLEESPSTIDDRSGEIASDITALAALYLQHRDGSASFSDAYLRDPGHRFQCVLRVGACRVNLQEHRLRSAKPRRQILRRVDGNHAPAVDDDHASARLADLWQDVRAQDDRMVAAELFNELTCFDDLLRVEARRRLVED